MHRRRNWFAAVPLLAAAVWAGNAWGQPRPVTGPNTPPATNVPGTLTGPGPVAPPAPVTFNDDPYNRSNGQDFPSADVHVAVDADARATFARAQLYRTQHALDVAIMDLTRLFEGSLDFKDSLKAEQQAWEDYTTARNSAIHPLVTDPKYQANVSMKEQMGDQIRERRQDKAGIQEIVILAHAKLDYAQVARDMEISLIKNDSGVAEARRKLIASGRKVTELRAKFDDSIRTNSDLIALRHGIEDARIAAITADAYRSGAVDAANAALDYAYYKNRFTYNYNGLGYPYSYGYGTNYVTGR